jgi:ABC-2 type transport system ATP-binding protein
LSDDDLPAESHATPAVHVENLSHAYPRPPKGPRRKPNAPPESDGKTAATDSAARPALDAVGLDVRPGEIFGILGPNGSGKSTLFRILATVLRPVPPQGRQPGRATIFGHDVLSEPQAVRRQLGVVFQMPSLDVKLTARENLMHEGHLYGQRGAELHARIDELLDLFNLKDRKDEYVERFSGGMRRRVEIAKAMLHRPRLLLLDEPSTGLDPGARSDLWRQLSHLRAEHGVTVALTTHLMDEADRCDRLAIMALGRVVAIDTPAALKARIGGDVITVEPAANGSPDAAADALAHDIADRFGPWDEGGQPAAIDGKVRFEKSDGPQFIATLSAAFPDRLRSVTVGHPTLEDVFMHLTGYALWEDR